VFFTNSGSEAADTSLKMARPTTAPRRGRAATRLIGRERGYHGVGFGGISVGGIGANRKHLRPGSTAWTTCPTRTTRGQRLHARHARERPELADALEA
jgi:beta-alanine--pyruvate transaminase